MKNVRMYKYRVSFQTEVQVDGWTDWRDREYKKVRETVVVSAPSIEAAKKIAVKTSPGYSRPQYWGPNCTSKWTVENVKKVTKVVKK